MKKLFLVAALLCAQVFGLGTVVVNRTNLGPDNQLVVIDWAGDATTALVPTKVVPLLGFVTKVITNPGSPAPTANYDIAFTDPEDSSLDLFATLLNNRHTTTSEVVYPAIAGTGGTVTSFPIHAGGNYTFSLTGQAASGAKGRVLIYLKSR